MTTVRRIAICGAGSVGWLAAATLARALRHRRLSITVLGSASPADEPRARWTLPSLRGLHSMLGISEVDFVQTTGATFKLASEHRDWQGDGSLFLHAHGDLGTTLPGAAFHQYLIHEAQHGRGRLPEEFSLAAHAAVLGRFARPMGAEGSLTASFTYGYHLDDRMYAQFLQSHAMRLGVTHEPADPLGVELDAQGNIEALLLSEGRRLSADLYLDCSGREAALISRVDSASRVDWSAALPCDRALSGFTPLDPQAPAATQTLATDNGWSWRIPLAARAAMGYLYCSEHLSDEQALSALQGQSLESPVVTPLRAGRRTQAWSRNCVALGAAAVELEPLAGADLQLAGLGIGTLIELFPVGEVSAIEGAEYNRIMAEHADGLRDFTLAHYHVGAARNAAFWSRLRAAPMPERLAHKLDIYFASGRIPLLDYETFEESDWAWLLLGGRRLPASLELQVREQVSRVGADDIATLREQIARLASTMPRHMDLVRSLNVARTAS